MKVEKECLYCKTKFLGAVSAKFCKTTHKTYYHRSGGPIKGTSPKNCLFCQKSFIGSPGKKFCCEEHKNKYHRKKKLKNHEPVKRTCLHCGEEFITSKLTKVYCSDRHRIAANAKTTGRKKKVKLETKRICFFCTTEFFSNVKSKFCSTDHMNLFRRAVRSKKPISVRVSSKITILTKKYDKIPEILQKYREHDADLKAIDSRFPL